MTRVVFAVPGDLASRTGGYAYARELLDHLPDCGIAIRHCALPASFPEPSDADLTATARALRAAAKDEVLLIDGLAFGALPTGLLATLDHPIVALVHHPLGYETGLSEATRQALIASERAALALADHVIVSSDTTHEVLVADFGVAATAITIAEPGARPVAPNPMARRSLLPVEEGDVLRPSISLREPTDQRSRTMRILAVGSVVPRKGFDVLITALSGMRDLDWRLRLVGSLDRAAATVQALHLQLAVSGIADRVELVGELGAEPLSKEYAAADLFVLPSHYEGYGMVLAEAMTYGLPIVTTTGGAAARTVPDVAALKVPTGDAPALAEALRKVASDAPLRRRLAEASQHAGRILPRWPETAARVAAVLNKVGQGVRV